MTRSALLYHRRPGETRQEDDFYATCPTAIPPLMGLLGWTGGGKVIWENSCGQGHLSEALKIYGHKVLSTDLVDRGYSFGGIDFLQPTIFDSGQYDAIIMNPPYKHALEFIRKSLTIAPIVCAFLRLAFLESEKRKTFFAENPPKYVAVFSQRVPCSKNALFPKDESSVQCYAWYIWQQGYEGDTIIKWI